MTLLNSILCQADSQYARQDWAAARDSLQVALGVAPEHPQLLSALGNLHFLLRDYPAACLAFIAAVHAEPENAEYSVQLALTHRELRQFDEAEAVLLHVLEARPDDLAVIRLLADCYRDGGRPQDAAAIYQVLLERDPEHQVEILLALAKLFHGVGDAAGARAALEQVLRLDPENEIACDNLAVLTEETQVTAAVHTVRRNAPRGRLARSRGPCLVDIARRGPPPRRRAPRRRRMSLVRLED